MEVELEPRVAPTATSQGRNNKSARDRRQEKWIKKCVSNFSLYANLVGNSCDDPFDEQQAIEAGEFKVIMSKSTKKRLRRQKKQQLRAAGDASKSRLGPRSAQIKKLNLALAKKQTKKDINKMIKKLSNLPLKGGESNANR